MVDIQETYVKHYRTEPVSTIDTAALKAIPWSGHSRVITTSAIATEEFVSRCPWSGLPDFAVVTLSYEPGPLLIEMKSFKIYITGFLDVGITMESACERICCDLGELLSPVFLTVEMRFKPRGGHSNVVVCKWTGAS